MEPQYLLFILGALACPIIMGGAMWLMMRQMNSLQMPMNAKTLPAHSVAALQAQRDALDQEIRELEAVQALQTQRAQLQRQVEAVVKEPQP